MRPLLQLGIVLGTFTRLCLILIKPWKIGNQFADKARGTQNLCGLPRNHKLQNNRD